MLTIWEGMSDSKRSCDCTGNWKGYTAQCVSPTFFFNENPTIITNEGGGTLQIKARRSMPPGLTTAAETQLRIQSLAGSATEGSDYVRIDETLTFAAGANAVHDWTVDFTTVEDALWEDAEVVQLKMTITSGPGTTVAPNPLNIKIMENDISYFRFHVTAVNNVGIGASETTITLKIERLYSFNRVATVGIRYDAAGSLPKGLSSTHGSWPETVVFQPNDITKEFILTCDACIAADAAGSALEAATIALDLHDALEEDFEFQQPQQITVAIAPRTARPTAAPTNAPTMIPTEDARNVAQKYVGNDSEGQVMLPVLLGVFAGLLALLLAVAIAVIIALTIITNRIKRQKVKNVTAMELDMAHLNVGMVEQSGIAMGSAFDAPGAVHKPSFRSNPMSTGGSPESYDVVE